MLAYLLLAVILEVALYAGRSSLESAIGKAVGAESVRIGRFFNMPFLNVQFYDVKIRALKGTRLEVERLRVEYDLAGLLFRGVPGAVKKTVIEGVKLQTSIVESRQISEILLRSLTHPGMKKDSAPLETVIEAKRLYARLTILATARIDLSSDDFLVRITGRKLTLDGLMTLDSRLTNIVTNNMGNDVGYLHSDFEVNLNLTNLIKPSGRCRIFFDDLSFAGIPLVEKDSLFLSIDGKVVPDIRNSGMTNWVSITDGRVDVDFRTNFSLRYEKYHEFQLLDSILPAGDYRAGLKLSVITNAFRLNAEVKPLSNEVSTGLELEMHSVSNGLAAAGWMASGKWGKAVADLTMDFGVLLPSGTLRLENVPFLNGGLRISGDAALASASNTMFARLKDVKVNGGYIGDVDDAITLVSNGVRCRTLPGQENGAVNGYISDAGYNIAIDAKDIPGPALVSNIRVDGLSLSKGRYNASMRIYSDTKNELEITGKIEGYREVLAQNVFEVKRMLSADLGFHNMRLSFSRIDLPLNSLGFHGYFDFVMTNYGSMWIDIGGNIDVFGRNVVPMNGHIGVLSAEGRTTADFVVDGTVTAGVTVIKNNVHAVIDARNYRLERIGLAGTLDGDVSLDLARMQLADLNVDVKYSVAGREANLRLATRPDHSGGLVFERFSLDLGSDNLLGSGSMRHAGDRLTGSVSFIRGGGIDFSASWSDLVAQLDIRNFLVKDFLFREQKAYVTAHLNFYGPLVFPNYTGSIRAVNPVDSPWLMLDVPDIARKWDSIGLKGASFEYRNHRIHGDFSLTFRKPGLSIRAQGDAVLAGFVKAGFRADYDSLPAVKNLDYALYDASLHGESIEDVSGGAHWEKGHWRVFRNGSYGVEGFADEDESGMDWALDFFWTGLKGNFGGRTVDNTIDANLNVTSRLSMVQFPQAFRKVEGNIKLETRLRGQMQSPDIDGSLKINNGNMVIDYVNTQIRKADLVVPIEKSKLILHGLLIPTTTGDFIVDGYVDIKDLSISYMDVTIVPVDKRPAAISLNIDNPNLKIIGNARVSRVNVAGTLTALQLSGEATAEDAFVLVDVDLGPKKKREPNLLDATIWNMTLTAGNNVKFTNPYIDTIIERGTVLQILGSLGNQTLTMKGEATVKSGTLTYLGRDFTISDGTARFSGMPGDLIPYVNINATYNYRDTENVTVYMTMDGKVNRMGMSEIYSVPDRNKSDLYALLVGGVTSTNTNTGISQIGSTTVSTMGNYLLFNPLSMTMRKTFGLDLVSIRSKIFENLIQTSVAGNVPFSMSQSLPQLFEGSSVVVGKYLFQDLLFQTELQVNTNQAGSFNLQPNIGFRYDPFHFLDIEVKYNNVFQQGGFNPTNIDFSLQLHSRF